MGQEIESEHFTEDDFIAFRSRLREETKTLKCWFEERRFDADEDLTIGLELEGWLIDENYLPAPRNKEFLTAVHNPDICEELSAFNFEMNDAPKTLTGTALSDTQEGLAATWTTCWRACDIVGVRPLLIGILPTVRDDMLQLEWLSEGARYRALNRELLNIRSSEPLHIRIEGHDELDYHCDNIMLEAACTSLQSHLKVSQDDAPRYYNAGILAAAPLVAATANSAYLYGKSLWCETRIPAFEQATAVKGFRDLAGRNVLRVTLGTGYLRNSFVEPFLENLSYPAVLPAIQETSERLPHLRMQNGTIWRWVRPIIGFDGQNRPHLRIEHRVIPAGPTLTDVTANLAMCHGLMLALAQAEVPPETETSFEEAHRNFYACAKDGLDADVTWAGRTVNVQSLLLNELLPKAREALERAHIARADLDRYFADVLVPRVRTGRTGAAWQRSFMTCENANVQAMTARYMELQAGGEPVHTWKV